MLRWAAREDVHPGKWLSTVSEFARNPIKYAEQLEKAGYETPEGILAAGKAEVLSKDYDLKIGIASCIREAAGGITGGGLGTQLQRSSTHQLSGPSGLSGPHEHACAGQLYLSIQSCKFYRQSVIFT